MDSSGIMEWQRTFGGIGQDEFNAVKELPDRSGFIAVGMTDFSGSGTGDAYIVRIDSEGGLIWEQKFTRQGREQLASLELTPEGEYIAAGFRIDSSGDEDVYAIRTRSNGDLRWEKTFSWDKTPSAYY